jgi:hypothetical protein
MGRRLIFPLLAAAALLAACAPRNPESWMAFEKNACLPTAIAMQRGLERQGISAKVVTYSYPDAETKRLTGHAITAYLFPQGHNQLWTYDFMGSYRTRAWFTDAHGIAQQAENLRGRPQNRIFQAQFEQ